MHELNCGLIELAKRLIAVPGYVELPEKETRTAEKLYEELSGMGLHARLIDHEGRYNVRCEYTCGLPGPTVVLCTHLDTVPPYEMKEPFCGNIRNGRLYGRGAVDVRGILAAMSMVMKRLEEEKTKIYGKVRFLAVADEESGSFGMRQEMAEGYEADVTIVGEPTELRLGIAHKGVAWIQIEFKGKTAHGSVPDAGHNAVYDAAHFLEYVTDHLIPKLKSERVHSLLGPATLNVGKIYGGTRTTIVPESCILQIDRRLIPGEDAKTALREINDAVRKSGRKGMEFCSSLILGDSGHPFPPLDSTDWPELAGCLTEAVASVTGEKHPGTGLPFWTDAALAGYYTGKPAFVLGPGSIAQAHSNDEYVEIAQLEQSAEIYYRMVTAISELSRAGGISPAYGERKVDDAAE